MLCLYHLKEHALSIRFFISALSKTCVCVIVTLRLLVSLWYPLQDLDHVLDLFHWRSPQKFWWKFGNTTKVKHHFNPCAIIPWIFLNPFFGESGLNGLQMSVLQIAFNRNTDTFSVRMHSKSMYIGWMTNAESCMKSMQQ